MARVVVVLMGTMALLVGADSVANAQVEFNPIDWSVVTTIIGRDGEDLPLRTGQHDAPNSEGFGIRHIEDGHNGFIPDPGLIQLAVESVSSNPNPNSTSTVTYVDANGRKFFVAWTERVDSRSPDGRPVGIITAFYP